MAVVIIYNNPSEKPLQKSKNIGMHYIKPIKVQESWLVLICSGMVNFLLILSTSLTMFPSCANTRKLGAHINVPSKNAFAHISYMVFQIQIQMSPSKMLHKQNLYAHTDFNKLEGTMITHQYT